MKIVEYKKIVPKPRHLLKFGSHFEESALTALSSTGIFAGNLISIALWLRFPKIVVSKNPPGGGAGFRLLAHRLMCLKNATLPIPFCSVKRNTAKHGMMAIILTIIHYLRGYCTPGQLWDCFCIFLKNYNTLVTSKICFL